MINRLQSQKIAFSSCIGSFTKGASCDSTPRQSVMLEVRSAPQTSDLVSNHLSRVDTIQAPMKCCQYEGCPTTRNVAFNTDTSQIP